MKKIEFKNFALIALFFTVLTALTACNLQNTDQVLSPSSTSNPNPNPNPNPSPSSAKMAADFTQERVFNGAELGLTEISEPTNTLAKKYIALSHHLQIEIAAQKMQASFDAAVAHCEALNCQLLSANFNRETPHSPPSANLSFRVPPRNVAIFLNGLAINNEVLQHGQTSEDKTSQVVDADARITNLTNLRDRLRLMLSDKTAKFKDIIAVERELANTQSELDNFTSTLQLLSLDTDFVAINIDFVAVQGIAEQGFFAPIKQALKNAGAVMMQSVGAVITFVMFVIPWLLIVLPLVWFLSWFYRQYRKKKKMLSLGRNSH